MADKKKKFEWIQSTIRATIVRLYAMLPKNPLSKLPAPLLYGYFKSRSLIYSDISDASPLKIIWVDPENIIYDDCAVPPRFGLVANGDWDKNVKYFEENIVFRSIKQRFLSNEKWVNTDLYHNFYQRLKEDTNALKRRGIYHVDNLDAYFERIDNLYHSISKYGYKTQNQLLKEDRITSDVSLDNPHILLNEISVNVFRDGTIGKHRSGNHRLSIAKIHPDVKSIPVLVRVRHTNWQHIRNEIKKARSVDELSTAAKSYLQHPDLQDIVPKSWLPHT